VTQHPNSLKKEIVESSKKIVRAIAIGSSVLAGLGLLSAESPKSNEVILAPSNLPTAPDTPTQQALDKVIKDLDAGDSAEVTAKPTSLPGPIGESVGQPIIFKVGKNNYEAFSQGSPTYFGQAPSQTEANFVIDKGPKSIPTTAAVLDNGTLVEKDARHLAVGYSSGADSVK